MRYILFSDLMFFCSFLPEPSDSLECCVVFKNHAKKSKIDFQSILKFFYVCTFQKFLFMTSQLCTGVTSAIFKTGRKLKEVH